MDLRSPGRDRWLEQLREHIASLRRRRPLPLREQLDAAKEWQCRIIGGGLLAWFREEERYFRAQESIIHLGDREPALPVFTSDVPGLVAAREIFAQAQPNAVAYLLDREYRRLPEHLADPQFEHHFTYSSRFVRLDRERERRARDKHPLPEGSEYWLHEVETVAGELVAELKGHLWVWDGSEPRLLEEQFEHSIS